MAAINGGWIGLGEGDGRFEGFEGKRSGSRRIHSRVGDFQGFVQRVADPLSDL